MAGRLRARCPACRFGSLWVESRQVEVKLGQDSYQVEVPGHACRQVAGSFQACQAWRPDRDWGDGSRRGGRTWRAAWKDHTRAFLTANPRCQDCRRAPSTESHHVQYRSRGGSDDRSNLAALCRTCHESRHEAGGRDDDE
mgnify:CR=1 FL=1